MTVTGIGMPNKKYLVRCTQTIDGMLAT